MALAMAGLFLTVVTAWSADTIVLGTVMSLTGKYAREGKFYADAYSITIDTINKAGGVKVGARPTNSN